MLVLNDPPAWRHLVPGLATRGVAVEETDDRRAHPAVAAQVEVESKR